MRKRCPHNRSIPSCAKGFTLLELVVTLAVAAILLGVAVPSYRGITQRNTVAARVNALVGDLNYARNEAVTRNRNVYLCKASSLQPPKCADSGTWSQGWIVYAPDPAAAGHAPTGDNILRVQSTLGGQISITGNNNISKDAYFDANGFAMGSIGTFTVHASGGAQKTLVRIASTGRVHTVRENAS